MKSVNLNLLEPSGPVQVCNGTALHFYLLNICSSTAEQREKISFISMAELKGCLLFVSTVAATGIQREGTCVFAVKMVARKRHEITLH